MESLDKILVKTVSQDKNLCEKIFFMEIIRHRKEIFGSLADKVTPIKIQDKILQVYANNSAVKDNLKFTAKNLVERINKIIGRGEIIIENISFAKNFQEPPKIPEPAAVEEKISEPEPVEVVRHKCKLCNNLCETGKILCDMCEIYERNNMRKRICKIFCEKPSTTFYKVQEKILSEMPHMKKECSLMTIESVWAGLINETAARVKYGDKTSDTAKFLVMLFKQVEEKDLTDALMNRAMKELQFNLAERPMIGANKIVS